jgi:hypothetical protein
LLIVLCYPSTSFHRNVFMDFLAPFNEQMFNMMCQVRFVFLFCYLCWSNQ